MYKLYKQLNWITNNDLLFDYEERLDKTEPCN